MALPSCRRCGTQDPQRMHGLMSLWFAPLIELEADLGYFYLCPSCHDEIIIPELARIQNRILELHPGHKVAEDAEFGAEDVGDVEDAENAENAENEENEENEEDAGEAGEADEPG